MRTLGRMARIETPLVQREAAPGQASPASEIEDAFISQLPQAHHLSDRGSHRKGTVVLTRDTGVPRLKPANPEDPTVEPCLGSYGGPRGGGRFLMSEVPLYREDKTDALEHHTNHVHRMYFKPGRARFAADVIRKEAWPFYRTISGVRLCWELEEPKGPKGRKASSVEPRRSEAGPLWVSRL